MRTVTVSDTNTVGAIKELVNELPEDHANIIENLVHELNQVAVEKYAINKVNHYEKMSVVDARKKK